MFFGVTVAEEVSAVGGRGPCSRVRVDLRADGAFRGEFGRLRQAAQQRLHAGSLAVERFFEHGHLPTHCLDLFRNSHAEKQKATLTTVKVAFEILVGPE